MTLLALLNVGSRELKIDGLEDFFLPQSGSAPLMDSNAVAEYLAQATDEELLDLVGRVGDANVPPRVRNEACFIDLDKRAPNGWHIALFANESEKFAYGSTLQLAQHFARWLRLARPHVTVHGPFSLSGLPHLPTDSMVASYEECLQSVLPLIPKVSRIVVLALGGTPAMRVLLERTAQVMAGGTKVESLTPTDDGAGVHRFGLLNVIRRDEVARTALVAIRTLCRRGEYGGAARAGREMGDLVPERVLQLLDVGGRMALNQQQWMVQESDRQDFLLPSDPPTWEWRVGAWIDLIRKALAAGAVDRALQLYVTAAEAGPAVWAERWATDLPWLLEDTVYPPGSCLQNGLTGGMPPNNRVTRSQRAAGCASGPHYERCTECPFNQTVDHDVCATAVFSTVARWGWLGTRSRLNSLRNQWVHPGAFPVQNQLHAAIDFDRHTLEHSGINLRPGAGLPELLVASISAVTGREVPRPLATIDQALGQLWRSTPAPD
jgi:hypothetical protein